MSTDTQNSAPVSVGPVVTLNGAQLLRALDFIAPDRDTDPTQLEGDVSISYGTGHAGSGYYCCLTYYPEEGAIMLDAEIADDLISSDTGQALTQQTLDDVKAGITARDAEIEALRKEIETLQDANKADAGQNYNDGFSDGVILALQLMSMHGDYGGTQYCELLSAAGPNQIVERAISEGMWEMSGLSQTPTAVERRAVIDAARKETQP